MAWPLTTDPAILRTDLPAFCALPEVRLLTFPALPPRLPFAQALAERHGAIREALQALGTDVTLRVGALVHTAEMAACVPGWQLPEHAEAFDASGRALEELAENVARFRDVSIFLGTARFSGDTGRGLFRGEGGVLTAARRPLAFNTFRVCTPERAFYQDKFAPYWGTQQDQREGFVENFEFQLAGDAGLYHWPLPDGGRALLLNCHEFKAWAASDRERLGRTFARLRTLVRGRRGQSWRVAEIERAQQRMDEAWVLLHDPEFVRSVRVVFHDLNYSSPAYLWSDWARIARGLPKSSRFRLFVTNQQVRPGLRITGQYAVRAGTAFLGYRDRAAHQVPLGRRYVAADWVA